MLKRGLDVIVSISPSFFLEMIRQKQRHFKFTQHALNRAEKRLMQLSICQEEILTKEPQNIEEQKSPVEGERQFSVYYKQNGDKYHRYVVALNNVIRVITMMRISKDLQSRWAQWHQ